MKKEIRRIIESKIVVYTIWSVAALLFIKVFFGGRFLTYIWHIKNQNSIHWDIINFKIPYTHVGEGMESKVASAKYRIRGIIGVGQPPIFLVKYLEN